MRKLFPLLKLRTLLIVANLTTLLLPIAGIIMLQLYESELVRQTESALIGQGGILAATFRQEILRRVEDKEKFLHDQPKPSNLQFTQQEELTPIRPRLDVAKEKVRPTAPEAVEAIHPPLIEVLSAGKFLEPVIQDAQRITLAGIRLVDHRGVVVASSGIEYGKSLLNREEVQGALGGEYISLLRQRISDEPPPTFSSISRRAWVRVFVAIPVVEEDRVLGAVVLSRSPIGVGRGLYRIRSHLFKATVVLLGLAIIVSLIATLTISRPIKSLIKQADRVGQGKENSAEPLHSPGTVEVARLSEAIAGMSASLASRAEYIRMFAQNVSHEFKTPLTSMRGTVELLQDHGATMQEEERRRFLANMALDIEGLTRMVRRLLELARADMIEPGAATCRAADVVEILRHRYESADVVFQMEEDLPEMKMESEVLLSILTNLIDNGLQHGDPEERVLVRGKKGAGEKTEWLISNDGEPISEANAEKIFRPFFTTARHRGGTGLGLTIVQALLLAHDGEIQLIPNQKGSTFKVII